MSLWNRVKKLWGADAEGVEDEKGSEEKGGEAEPHADPREAYLLGLAEPRAPVQRVEIAKAVDELRHDGRELRAVELLSRALRARPGDEEITAALAFLHMDRLEAEPAKPLLEELTRSLEHGLTAELMLGEIAEREGDAQGALRHYERVLAKDVTHGQALVRAKKLREKLGESEKPMAQATVVQPEGAATQGRYQLLRELGRGGAAAVYLAKDRHIDREVALKVYHPQVMRDDGATQLAREAALPARIAHPGIVKVLDVDPKLGALIMEHLPGGSVKDVLKKGSLDLDRALRLTEAICRPLAALHEQGIVHRDIKPGNILLRDDGLDDPVITDLGVALLPGEEHVPGVGTPAYMAPEQRTEDRVDARADVYAVGVMLAAMLGGYPGPAGAVGDLIDRCLSDNPGGRPRDASELTTLLAALRFAAKHEDDYQRTLARIVEAGAEG